MKKPELLAPAGSLEHVVMALAYGADAVYAGIPRWSLRVRGNGFTRDDFQHGIELAHQYGRKFFAVLNVIPHMRRAGSFIKDLDEIAVLKPDAFIMADPGLIMQAHARYPEIPIHLSVQANTVNAMTVKFWQQQGIARCILARELSLSEIAMIREACPDAELEVFGHGALCIAVSGRCLISGMISHRDANLGTCNNACRWGYKVRSLSCEIEEPTRHAGDWMELNEDEHGSYLMNSKDLCTLPVLGKLMDIGIDCLKIEGRSRSPFYTAAVTRAYRLAIDALGAGQEIPPEAYTIVNAIPARDYTTGMLEPHRPDETQNYLTNSPHPGRWQVCGAVEKQDQDRLYIRVKNRFTRESNLLLFTPQGIHKLETHDLRTYNNEPLEIAPGDGHFATLPYAGLCDPKTAFLLRED